MSQVTNIQHQLRNIQATVRDSYLLIREFSLPLVLFLFSQIGGGLLYYQLSIIAGEPKINIVESIYHVLGLTFLQPLGDFPNAWYLEAFFFIMPVIGILILSQGITEFGIMFFNRQQRSKEWEMAVASTFQNHHILVGLGHLGYRVVRSLHGLGQNVVVIELNPSADLTATVQQLSIPVIKDDAKRSEALNSAGVQRANTIILCTQNDSLNLQIALKARRLNQKIKVIIRIFDEDFAQALHDQFGFTALSATQMAAPFFAATAAGIDMTQPISVDGQLLSLAHLKLSQNSSLIDLNISAVEDRFNVSVVLLRRNNFSDLHPNAMVQLEVNDNLAILGGPEEIKRILQENLLK